MTSPLPLCPLHPTKDNYTWASCTLNRCAWWVEETGLCAILNISLNLVALGITIEEAQEKGEASAQSTRGVGDPPLLPM